MGDKGTNRNDINSTPQTCQIETRRDSNENDRRNETFLCPPETRSSVDIDVDDIAFEHNDTPSETVSNPLLYDGKKPKWWKKLGRRKGTKGQRNAINMMTQKGFVIPKLNKYLHVINLQKLIECVPRNSPLTSEDLLVSREEYDDQINDELQSKFFDGKIIHLEIGFGQGENLLTNAMMNPEEFFIGAEIHQPGVGMALNRIKQSLEATNGMRFWRDQDWWIDDKTHDQQQWDGDKNDQIEEIIKSLETKSTEPYDNLRIFPGDGVKILKFLPLSSIDKIYLTFPDPWPKTGNTQYRVIQEETVNLIHSILKPNGCFFLATDAVCFDEWTREVFENVQKKSVHCEGTSYWEEVDPYPNRRTWLPVLSKYEKKGIEEGRFTICRCWRKIK